MKNYKLLPDEQIESEFSNFIREKMNDFQFWQWVATWKDGDDICDDAESWDIDDKRDFLIEQSNIPMFLTLYLTPDELEAIKYHLQWNIKDFKNNDRWFADKNNLQLTKSVLKKITKIK